jgi:hypothetical protein
VAASAGPALALEESETLETEAQVNGGGGLA